MRLIGVICTLMLLGGCLQTPDAPVSDDAQTIAEPEDSTSATAATQEGNSTGEASEDTDEPASGGAKAQGASEDASRRGLFGLFGSKRNKSIETQEDSQQVAAKEATEDESVKEPDSEAEAAESAYEKPARRGLFGPRRKQAMEPSVEPGTVLPFGEIGVACGVRGRALGKEVDRFPDKGKEYRLYDSNPSSTAPRTHYLTGFKDGCPRQFTAALALIGSPVLHEQMRYDPYNKDISITEADKAYERIKRRICKVPKGEPCPEKRVAALEKGMAFVTLYERFGSNASWEEVLLHNGQIAGSSLRKR